MSQILNLLSEVLNFVSSTGCFETLGTGNGTDIDHCPGSVLHPVTAALATQGYWMQADILWHLRFTNFQTWAILVYLVACIGAICGMAFGAPPKLWIWLFVGPGIFLFLIDTTSPVYGVRWYVGPDSENDSTFAGTQLLSATRSQRAMRRVWKLSEVGLANSSIAISGNTESEIGNLLGLGGLFGGQVTVYNDGHPTGQTKTQMPGDPEGTVRIAWVYLWADWVFSDFVEWIVWWTGLFNSGVGSDIANITRSNLPLGGTGGLTEATGLSFLSGNPTDTTREDDQAWLLSKNKWSYLMDITGAQLHNGDLRDAFVTMMSSECGDALRKGIDEASYVAALNARGMNLPPSVFKANDSTGGELYKIAMTEVSSTHIPTPPAVRAMFDSDGQGSFRKAIPFLRDNAVATQWMESGIMDTIGCDQLLTIVVEGFRWESAHIYYQLLTALPPEMSPLTLMYTLFYGWDMKRAEQGSSNLFNFDSTWNFDYFLNGDLVTPIKTPDEQAEFLQNLIFVHLMRNELQLAPKPFRGRVNEGAKSVQDVNTYQSRTGSRNKFGEVHTWSIMIPYIQGVLLYLLAMSYPFICMMMLIPGRHKSLMTWLSFFVWTKLWDVGFAVVMVLERSIWAMLGNGPNTGRVFSRVLDMQEIGDYQVRCPEGLATANPPYTLCSPGVVPDVLVGRTAGGGDITESLYMSEVFRYFDAGLTIGGNLQLDLANSYYIYIMSALYFAVPAVTGQMVLGAKAGAAGLASGAISGLASESGRAAGQGYTAGQSRIGGNNNGVVTASEKNQAMRQSGIASAALEHGNNALQGELQSQALSTQNDALKQSARGASMGSEQKRNANTETQQRQENRTAGAPAIDMGVNATSGGINAIKNGRGGGAAITDAIKGGGSVPLVGSLSNSTGGGGGSSTPSMEQSALTRSLGGSSSSGSSSSSGGSSSSSGSSPQSFVSSQQASSVTPTTPANTKNKGAGMGDLSTNGGQFGVAGGVINNAGRSKAGATNANTSRNQTQNQLGYEQGQAATMIAGARSKMDAAVSSKASGALGQFAETQAAMASYGNVRNFQEGTADYLGAIGGNSGAVSGASGSLANQSMTGLAAMGQLNKGGDKGTQDKAVMGMGGTANGDSFFGYNARENQRLNSTFGPEAVGATYNKNQTDATNQSDKTERSLGQPILNDTGGGRKSAEATAKN